jgi:hypothetical protein
METSASCEARSAPSSYPTGPTTWRQSSEDRYSFGFGQVVRCRNAGVPCKHLEAWPQTYEHPGKRGNQGI